MTFSDFKDLQRRAPSDKVLLEKVFNITKNPKYEVNQREIVSIV